MWKKFKSLSLAVHFFLLFTFSAQAADLYIFGIKGKWIKKAKWSQVIAGAVGSVAVHELGHVVALEVTGTEYKFTSPVNIKWGEATDEEARWISRSGFIAQHGMNLVLTTVARESDFTRGFTLMSGVTQLANYNGTDMRTLKDRGGSRGEWWAFTGITLHNILRVEW